MAGIDPDEVVAMGAAIQASSLLDSKSEHYLLDVTPLTLRVGTVGGYTDKIIDKNTPIPIERSKSYTTNRDGQEKVKIRVYQGESNKASECELLGEFEFSGFRIGYRGEVRIEVTFEIDPNGIVNVTAADVETGQKTSCTIRLSSGLTEEMIQTAQEKNAKTTLARGEAA
jgi:molecular chaperone DnaK